MRLQTIIAPTIQSAMEEIRGLLGPDAIILSTTERPDGQGVEVRAAVESATPNGVANDLAFDLDERLNEQLRMRLAASRDGNDAENTAKPKVFDPEKISQALRFHSFQAPLGPALRRAAIAVGLEDTELALASALDARLRFAPISKTSSRPIMLVGPPGVGKTVTVAKLMANAALNGGRTFVATTDTRRSGAVAQLSELGRLLHLDVECAETPARLSRALKNAADDGAEPCARFVDTPAINPLCREDLGWLNDFLSETECEPVLVLAAGGDPLDLIDSAAIFASIGVRRMITTRLDASRRMGGIISAADAADLALAQVSISPYVAEGLRPLNPPALARLLLEHSENSVAPSGISTNVSNSEGRTAS
jgi:flagellar biosynthesis protein FlhF